MGNVMVMVIVNVIVTVRLRGVERKNIQLRVFFMISRPLSIYSFVMTSGGSRRMPGPAVRTSRPFAMSLFAISLLL